MPRALYCTAQSVADYLNIGETLTDTSDPSIPQVEKFIRWAMEEMERRTHRAWGDPKVFTKETRDVPAAYHFSRGIPFYMSHQDVLPLDSSAGDKVEAWDGSEYRDVLASGDLTYTQNEKYGKIWIKGYVWSWLRDDRIRFTYRYGSALTPDVEEICIKLTCVKWLERSFNLDNISFGGSISPKEAIEKWRMEIDAWVSEVSEWVVLEP